MEIQSRVEKGAAVLTVTGRLDALTAPKYQEELDGLIARGTTAVIVDVDGLDYISSGGLRVILTTAQALKGKGGHVRFVNVKGTVRKVFELSGFDGIFPLHDSVDSALSAIG